MSILTGPATRRLFLRRFGALSACTGAGAPLALNLLASAGAAAQSAADYRALVCVFMAGGNDSHNMLMATDPTSWAAYTAARAGGAEPLALRAAGIAPDTSAALGTLARLGGVLPIEPVHAQGRSYALHPTLQPLQALFAAGRLAVLPNVGPLVMPTTKAQYAQASHRKPRRLFSHPDQQNAWHAAGLESAASGWGGRMADLLAGGNSQPVFTAVSASGAALWLAGDSVRPYQIGSGGAVRLGSDAAGKLYGSVAAAEALQRVVSSSPGGHLLEGDVATVARRSMDAERLLRTALRPAGEDPFGTPATGTYKPETDPLLQYEPPQYAVKSFNSFARQLQAVARMIEAGMSGATGVRRQVFFVSLGSFDTHAQQTRRHADLMARLAQGLAYFDRALAAVGADRAVTTFTASDFGRSLVSNGDGTDHGWGAHHLVLGGAVRGGDLYGNFPFIGPVNTGGSGFDSSPQLLNNGVLLPETSVDQMGATLARWFGLGASQALDVFPNLSNFDVARRELGFMNA